MRRAKRRNSKEMLNNIKSINLSIHDTQWVLVSTLAEISLSSMNQVLKSCLKNVNGEQKKLFYSSFSAEIEDFMIYFSGIIDILEESLDSTISAELQLQFADAALGCITLMEKYYKHPKKVKKILKEAGIQWNEVS